MATPTANANHRRLLTGLTLILVLVPAALAFLYLVRDLITPALSGALAAYLLYPVMRLGDRFGVARGLLVTLLILLIVGGLLYSGYALWPAVQREVQVLAMGQEAANLAHSKVVRVVAHLSQQLRDYGLTTRELENQEIVRWAAAWVAEQGLSLLTEAQALVVRGGQFLMVFLFIMVFGLLDGHRFYRGLLQVLPNATFESGVFVLNQTEAIFGYYLRGLVVESLILGVICYALLLLACIFTPLTPVLALVIAVVVAITNPVRIIGPFFGGFVGVILVLFSTASLPAIFCVLGAVVITQFLDNVLVLPLVMREQVNIHPVLCLLSVLSGGIIGGVLGMVLAIPVIAGFKAVHRVLAVEMKKLTLGGEPELDLPAIAWSPPTPTPPAPPPAP